MKLQVDKKKPYKKPDTKRKVNWQKKLLNVDKLFIVKFVKLIQLEGVGALWQSNEKKII